MLFPVSLKPCEERRVDDRGDLVGRKRWTRVLLLEIARVDVKPVERVRADPATAAIAFQPREERRDGRNVALLRDRRQRAGTLTLSLFDRLPKREPLVGIFLLVAGRDARERVDELLRFYEADGRDGSIATDELGELREHHAVLLHAGRLLLLRLQERGRVDLEKL